MSLLSQTTHIQLPVTLTIETVEAFAEDLKALEWGENPTVTLDTSTNEIISTTGIQLILSLKKTLEAQGGLLVIQGGNASLPNAFKELGLSDIFH